MKKRPHKKLSIILFFLVLIAHFNCSKKDPTYAENQATEAVHLRRSSKDGALKKGLPDSLTRKRPPIAPSNQLEKLLVSSPAETGKSSAKPAGKSSVATMSTVTSTYGCGSSISDNYYGGGFYRYPDYSLDLGSTPEFSTINISVGSYDVPNRFDIYDANGNLVASSGWIGYADYSGPWGGYLNTAQSMTLTFYRNAKVNYTMRVETSTQDYSDSWHASVSCISSVVIAAVNDQTTRNHMIHSFNSLQVNLQQLSSALGLSYTLSANDIDFQNLSRSYLANDNETGEGILAPFKTNAFSNTANYAYFLSKDGNSWAKPMIVKVTNQTFQFFELDDEGLVTSIYNYRSPSMTTNIAAGNYITGLRRCGHGAALCIADAYTNHGWLSVWAFVQTLYIPATGVAIATACVARNCLKGKI